MLVAVHFRVNTVPTELFMLVAHNLGEIFANLYMLVALHFRVYTVSTELIMLVAV